MRYAYGEVIPVTKDDYSKALLALVLWRENRNAGREGYRSVGHVIRNRVNAHWGDWSAVITGRNQFSSMSYPKDPQLTKYPAVGDPVFLDILQVVDGIFDGSDADITGGALWYANLATMDKGGWFETNIVNQPNAHARTVQIGGHTFFK